MDPPLTGLQKQSINPRLCINASLYKKRHFRAQDRRPHQGTDGISRIIKKHNDDEATVHALPQTERAIGDQIKTLKTKTAQPLSGTAPFSAI
ncbi:hypothetical protein [Pseudomonas uvaldensis]|uniref:hypothetical protein n=1 Tax=Pseudomonas uvaldensis TaxID=2878385 RepID=UPI001E45DA78|nr:hypothetical protein [Pseudomonas uvaldensis]MCE0459903.1 hypothetical protein [Pseudomonas uvaldensis]